jgi:predicted DsbA family dithiol-disulfide isomerase
LRAIDEEDPMHPDASQVAMFADLSCPFAYVAHARWRRVRDEFRGRVALVHKSLALEYVNRQPTPKVATEAELAVLVLNEPSLPYAPWTRADSEWPVTLWPAFEAVKCAERQSLSLADDLAWAIRVAFFAEHHCVSMRHVLLDLAQRTGLDGARFEADFDAGIAKRLVVEEARQGWERLKVPGSPTFVLATGEPIAPPGLPELEVDARSGRVTVTVAADCAGDACLDRYRAIFAAVG